MLFSLYKLVPHTHTQVRFMDTKETQENVSNSVLFIRGAHILRANTFPYTRHIHAHTHTPTHTHTHTRTLRRLETEPDTSQ